VTDSSGLAVYATVVQNQGSPGGYNPQTGTQKGDLCGKTKKPISITGGQRVTVYLYAGPSQSGCAGAATSGDVTATFTP
jgi:hypothetical protein